MAAWALASASPALSEPTDSDSACKLAMACSAARRLNGALDRHALLAQGLASPLVEAKVVRGAIGRPQGITTDVTGWNSRRGRVQNDGSVRRKYAGILDSQERGSLLPLVPRLRCRRGGVPRSQDHGRSVHFSPTLPPNLELDSRARWAMAGFATTARIGSRGSTLASRP